MPQDFTLLSSINAYLKNNANMKKWQKRQEDINSFRAEQERQAKNRPDYIKNGIVRRFKGGQDVSSGDLAYLAEKDPQLYGQIAPVVKKRKEIQQKLSSCRSKEEARRVYREALTIAGSFAAGNAGASVVQGDGAAGVSMGEQPAMFDSGTFLKFIESDWHYYRHSSKFQKLPDKKRDLLIRLKKSSDG